MSMVGVDHLWNSVRLLALSLVQSVFDENQEYLRSILLSVAAPTSSAVEVEREIPELLANASLLW